MAPAAAMTGTPTTTRARRLRPLLRWLLPANLALSGALAWGTLLAGGITGVYAWVVLGVVLPVLALAVLLATLVYALWQRRVTAPLWVSRLLALFLLWPGAWLFGVAQIRYPGSMNAAQPAATVRLPLDGPLRVLWGGDDLRSNYHAFSPDQRWAYDLGVDPVQTGSNELADYGCWGKAVLAPAAGRVQWTHDGMPDSTPGALSNPAAPFGNFVSLELASGTHLLLAHLQPGLAVQPGDVVSEGQLLGRCGNSGHSSEPHVHLHHQRQPVHDRIGFAEGLPLFFRDHDGAAMPSGGVNIVGESAELLGPVLHHLGSTSPASATGAQKGQ